MPVSECCGVEAGEYLDYGLCPECKEHCDFVDDDEEEDIPEKEIKNEQ